MAIHSSAFGRVTLTEEDAVKFQNQVKYGRPKAIAAQSVKQGVEAVKQLHKQNGSLSFTFKTKAK